MLEGSGKEVTTSRMVEAITKGHAEVEDMLLYYKIRCDISCDRRLNTILVSVDHQCTKRTAKSSWKRKENLQYTTNRARGIDATCKRVSMVIYQSTDVHCNGRFPL